MFQVSYLTVLQAAPVRIDAREGPGIRDGRGGRGIADLIDDLSPCLLPFCYDLYDVDRFDLRFLLMCYDHDYDLLCI